MQLITETTATTTTTTTINSSLTNKAKAPNTTTPPATAVASTAAAAAATAATTATAISATNWQKPKVNAFNELFTCYLCQGYMINPTAIDNCMHAYCRSCIVKYLLSESFCPQCELNNRKPVTLANLKSDDIMRSIIYKLVPGLYHNEWERVNKFTNNSQLNNENTTSSTAIAVNCPAELENFFAPTEPISLCLEYHPYFAKQAADENSLPPVRYLQCPATFKIHHLKRFLYSKYDINASNRSVGLDIMYEYEILPNDFTLMDVAYCYEWKRRAPMKFTYRILIYSEGLLPPKELITPSEGTKVSDIVEKTSPMPPPVQPLTAKRNDLNKTVINPEEQPQLLAAPPPMQFTSASVSNTSNTKHKSKTSKTREMSSQELKAPVKSQVTKSAYDFEEELDNQTLSQLKNASRKSSHNSVKEIAKESRKEESVKSKPKNVPKLKIELNSLKSKLIEKPKSADIRLDNLMEHRAKQRKLSLDESKPLKEKIDLKTYAKSIGLKPIEVQTNVEVSEVSHDKYTPNASPMSSCSSTTSSSNGNINHGSIADHSTSSSSSSHKKRKKKHSKESRESGGSKRKKLHAEISSHSAEESLKMKVKLTPPHKSHKQDHKRPAAILLAPELEKLSTNLKQMPLDTTPSSNDKNKKELTQEPQRSTISALTTATETITSCTTSSSKRLQDAKTCIPAPILITKEANKTTVAITKTLACIKGSKLPASPPLPPSLFKTTPLTFTTFSTANANSNNTIVASKVNLKLPEKEKFKPMQQFVKSIAAPLKPNVSGSLATLATKTPYFAIPNPPRPINSNSNKYLNTPASIASEANKQLGNLLKRSASLDESSSSKIGSGLLASCAANKQLKLDHSSKMKCYGGAKISKVALSGNYHLKSSDIPLYSPLSSAYNQTCSVPKSYSVSSSKAVLSNAKVPSGTVTTLTTQANPIATQATKPSIEIVRFSSANEIIKPVALLNSPTKSNTVMGPPLSLARVTKKPSLTGLKVVPTAIKSPPLSTIISLNSSKLPITSVNSPAIMNFRNSLAIPSQSKTPPITGSKKNESSTVTINAIIAASNSGGMGSEKPKCSLREFRLPSRDSPSDILDLSASKKVPTGTNGTSVMKRQLATISAAAGGSLEMALNKIKQNMGSNANNSESCNSVSTTSKAYSKSITSSTPNQDDLLNLHMLSESATAREKIAIPGSVTSSIYGKTKLGQTALVRQQNASVRNIPNPSALAFRNQQPIMVPLVTIPKSLTLNANDNNLSIKPKTEPSTPPRIPLSSTVTPQSTNTTTTINSSMSPSRSVTTSTKKHASIDEVAATLNIRAAAAEASAKATLINAINTSTTTTSGTHNNEEPVQVTTTSSLKAIDQPTKTNNVMVDKKESLTATDKSAQQSSTVVSDILGVVEIKQEIPDDQHSESIAEQTEIKTELPTTTTTAITSLAFANKDETCSSAVENTSTTTTTTNTTASAKF
uniref:RING-type domain-containing protein n=1 Tax=Glossina austeni TaxID=7395 RepID=A0A1A9UST2_GLOAU